MLNKFFLVFIPVFVAVDALGVLPVFVSLTQGLAKKTKRKVIWRSMLTASLVAFIFIFLGKAFFNFLGITIGDFMVGGGVLLLVLAVADIISVRKNGRHSPEELGAVPIGTPLIVGPAVLTTSLILQGEYGVWLTLLSVVLNILIAGLVFASSALLMKLLGENGSRAMSKITNLLLAAIAIKLIRKGILLFIGSL